MTDIADPMQVSTGPAGSVWLAKNAPSHRQWAALGVRDRAKLIGRFNLICTATSPLPKDKVRPIRGVKGVLEIKVKKPALRAMAFRDGLEWHVTHIIKKPKKRHVEKEAKRCLDVWETHHKATQLRVITNQ